MVDDHPAALQALCSYRGAFAQITGPARGRFDLTEVYEFLERQARQPEPPLR